MASGRTAAQVCTTSPAGGAVLEFFSCTKQASTRSQPEEHGSQLKPTLHDEQLTPPLNSSVSGTTTSKDERLASKLPYEIVSPEQDSREAPSVDCTSGPNTAGGPLRPSCQLNACDPMHAAPKSLPEQYPAFSLPLARTQAFPVLPQLVLPDQHVETVHRKERSCVSVAPRAFPRHHHLVATSPDRLNGLPVPAAAWPAIHQAYLRRLGHRQIHHCNLPRQHTQRQWALATPQSSKSALALCVLASSGGAGTLVDVLQRGALRQHRRRVALIVIAQWRRFTRARLLDRDQGWRHWRRKLLHCALHALFVDAAAVRQGP